MKKKEDLVALAATFVATVRRLQQAADVSDAELSRAIDLDRGTLSRLLSGETTDPRLSTISAIAKFFGIPISTLFGEENRGLVPVYNQRNLRSVRHGDVPPSHDQMWIKVSDVGASRFAVALDPKSRTTALPSNAILVIGDYQSLEPGDLVIAENGEGNYAIFKITDNGMLAGYDIESSRKRQSIPIAEHSIIGKALEIIIVN